MDSSAHRSDPFSASDEAFFEAGVQSEREAPSERPVVLEGSGVPEGDAIPTGASRDPSPRDARQARLLRAVTSTLAGLSLLALVGFARYALRPGVDAFEQPTPVAVRAPAASVAVEPAPHEAASIEVAAASLIASSDDNVVRDEALVCSPLVTVTTVPLPTETTVPVATETTVPPSAEPSSTEPSPPKLSKRAPVRHGAKPAHQRAKTPAVSKAALLRAIRAS